MISKKIIEAHGGHVGVSNILRFETHGCKWLEAHYTINISNIGHFRGSGWGLLFFLRNTTHRVFRRTNACAAKRSDVRHRCDWQRSLVNDKSSVEIHRKCTSNFLSKKYDGGPAHLGRYCWTCLAIKWFLELDSHYCFCTSWGHYPRTRKKYEFHEWNRSKSGRGSENGCNGKFLRKYTHDEAEKGTDCWRLTFVCENGEWV